MRLCSPFTKLLPALLSFILVGAIQIDLLTATVADLVTLLDSGKVTSENLVKSYLSRINENNYKGLHVRAVLEIAPYESLIAQARDCDADRKKGKSRGKLHGIPILVKDNIATDASLGMNTSAGSFTLLGSVVPRDATVVDKLRKAGAIILGKSNLSEFSQFKGNNTDGWSARGGQTQSAYVVGGFAAGGNPCGSSSGSAVGVSAGFAPVALGSETDGSIICPGNRAALYGIKPTVGLVSRAGVIPISTNQDTVGPMAKSAYDAALILSVIAGQDPLDKRTSEIPSDTPADYTQFTFNATFSGLRLGVPRKFFFDLKYVEHPEIIETVNAAIHKIASLGAKIEDPTDFAIPDDVVDIVQQTEAFVCLTDFKVEIEKYLEGLNGTDIRTLEDIINFNDAHSDIEFPPGQCCQQIFVASIQTTGIETEEYQMALAENIRIGGKDGIDAVLNKYNLDALIVPSEGMVTTPPALVGYPIVTVPLGVLRKNGQPFGLSFIGTKYSEPTLIRLMAAFEASFPPRVVPKQLISSMGRVFHIFQKAGALFTSIVFPIKKV